MSDSDYDDGYQAGIRCDPIPDDASDEWQFGYADALEMDTKLAALTISHMPWLKDADPTPEVIGPPVYVPLVETRRIKQYRPAFIEGSQTVVPFETVEELLAIPFVAAFQAEPEFYRFSLEIASSVSLIAEYDAGRRCFVVGFIEGSPPDLPKWEPVR